MFLIKTMEVRLYQDYKMLPFLRILLYVVHFIPVCLSGDLFVDGKVIHRPQYWYDERQATRNRPRPRYDRRRESMQVERRETMRNSGQQGQQVQQASSSDQNPPQGGQ